MEQYEKKFIKLLDESDYTESGRKLVLDAFYFAKEQHEGQFRKSGEPYFVHLVEVGNFLLTEVPLGPITVAAGLLHDVIEDTPVTNQQLEEKFGKTITHIVEGVTRLDNLDLSKSELEKKDLQKLFIAMSKDIRVIIVKIADRYHNMQTISFLSEEKQRHKAQETLDNYAPIAHRLGLYKVKRELEDISFKILQPDRYYEIASLLDDKRNEREQYIEALLNMICDDFEEHEVSYKVKGRSKHIYGIYSKIDKKGIPFDQIYDLYAIRIIVNEISDCYTALGMVHQMFTTVPGRFKDYISLPKKNGYRSIHTTVIGPGSKYFEIQIRTNEMDQYAEYGIASHWKYKDIEVTEDGVEELDQLESKISWINDLKKIVDSDDFVEIIRRDVIDGNVCVFTPKGQPIYLPTGASPIDMAYKIHSDMGNQYVAAMVNDVEVQMDYKLNNGDVVKILTSENSEGPERKWLYYTVTNFAKAQIKKALAKEVKEENVEKGRAILEHEIDELGYDINSQNVQQKLLNVVTILKAVSYDNLCALIGSTKIDVDMVLDLLEQQLGEFDDNEFAKMIGKQKKSTTSIVDVKTDKPVYIATCCKPLPGDKIIKVEVSDSVIIHRKSCPMTIGVAHNPAQWHSNYKGRLALPVMLEITALNVPMINMNIAKIIGKYIMDVKYVEGKPLPEGKFKFEYTLIIDTMDSMQLLKEEIKELPAVLSVKRL